jgi:hypothetical protein
MYEGTALHRQHIVNRFRLSPSDGLPRGVPEMDEDALFYVRSFIADGSVFDGEPDGETDEGPMRQDEANAWAQGHTAGPGTRLQVVSDYKAAFANFSANWWRE